MAGAVVNDIVADVITELSQVPGVATQLYASGRITQHVQDAMQLELDEMWWPDLMYYQRVPLDGTTGRLTQDLKGPISFIDDYTDIAAAFPDGGNRKISELPPSINPFNLTSTAFSPTFMSPDATIPHRPVMFWPQTTTGSVVLWARQSPTFPVNGNTPILLDRLLITYDACWMYCVDDGTVPAQVNKFQMLAVKRRKQVKANFSQHPLQLDPRFPADAALFDDFTQGSFTIGGQSGVLG